MMLSLAYISNRPRWIPHPLEKSVKFSAFYPSQATLTAKPISPSKIVLCCFHLIRSLFAEAGGLISPANLTIEDLNVPRCQHVPFCELREVCTWSHIRDEISSRDLQGILEAEATPFVGEHDWYCWVSVDCLSCDLQSPDQSASIGSPMGSLYR